MFSPGLELHSGNNNGVVKTEAIFGFGPNKTLDQNSLTSSEPLAMFFEEQNFGRSFKDTNKSSQKQLKKIRKTNIKTMERKKRQKHSKHKIKKCIYKLLKGKRKKLKYLRKKFHLPLLISIVILKSLLLPLALKVLAFVLLKGILTGFISATLLSLRRVLSHSYGYHRRYDGDKQTKKTRKSYGIL